MSKKTDHISVVVPENTLKNQTLFELSKMGRMLAAELSSPSASVSISDCVFNVSKTPAISVKTVQKK